MKWNVEIVTAPPAGLDTLIEEVAQALTAVYGVRAGEAYRKTAPESLPALLAHPKCTAVAGVANHTLAGLLLALPQADREHIVLLHVMRPWRGQGLEDLLVQRCVARLREKGASGIVLDTVPTAPLNLSPVFLRLGFRRIPRQYRVAPVREGPLALPAPACGSPTPQEAAECLAQAYAGAPDRDLHAELADTSSARAFVDEVRQGAYGLFREGFLQGLFLEKQCTGVALGCEVAPGMGYLFHIGVRPHWRGQGQAERLIRGLAQSFRDANLDRMGLCVTATHPAAALYERLGFKIVCESNAFVSAGANVPSDFS